MAKRIDLVGGKYGRLTVVGESEQYVSPSGHKNRVWLCQCECGELVEVQHSNLRCGTTQSCGCLQKELLSEKLKTHGMTDTRVHRIWCNMKARCSNPKYTKYKDYGGRGISYEARWESFENFWEDMGEGYSGELTLERVDVNKGYSRDNCIWASYKDQAKNKRKMVNNTSGITGVSKKRYRGCEYWIASWHNLEGKRKSKAFSILKFGEERARMLAEEYRNNIILELNKQGANYSASHGK